MNSLNKQQVGDLPELDTLVDFEITINNGSRMVGWLQKPNKIALKLALVRISDEHEIHINEVLDQYAINRAEYYNYIDSADEENVLQSDVPKAEHTCRKYSDTSKLTLTEKRRLFELVEEMRLAGNIIPVACKKVGITESAYRRWRDDPSYLQGVNSDSALKKRSSPNRTNRTIESQAEQDIIVESVSLLVRSKMASVREACKLLLVSYKDFRLWKQQVATEPVFSVGKGGIAKPKPQELQVRPLQVDRLMLATEYIAEQTDLHREQILTAIGYNKPTQEYWDRMYSLIENTSVSTQLSFSAVGDLASQIQVSRNELLDWMHEFGMVSDTFFKEHYVPGVSLESETLLQEQQSRLDYKEKVPTRRQVTYRTIESDEEKIIACEAVHTLARAGLCNSVQAKRAIGIRVEDFRDWNQSVQPIFAIKKGCKKPTFGERNAITKAHIMRLQEVVAYIIAHTDYTAEATWLGLGFRTDELKKRAQIEQVLGAMNEPVTTAGAEELAQQLDVSIKEVADWLFAYGLLSQELHEHIATRIKVIPVPAMIHGKAANNVYDLDLIAEVGINYIPSDEFLDAKKVDAIRNPLPHDSLAELVPTGLIDGINVREIAFCEPIATWSSETLRIVEPMSREQECHEFRRYNLLKYEAAQLLAAYVVADNQEKVGLKQKLLDYLRAVDTVRAEIVHFNVRLVYSIVIQQTKKSADDTDELGEAHGALLRAIEKFDYTRGFKFSTYATHAIQRNLWRQLQRKSKQKQQFGPLTDMVQSNLTYAGSDPDCATEAQVAYYRQQLSLAIIEVLDEREAGIITLRYGLGDEEPYTLGMAGERFGVTKERIRQIQSEAVGKLKIYITTFFPELASLFSTLEQEDLKQSVA